MRIGLEIQPNAWETFPQSSMRSDLVEYLHLASLICRHHVHVGLAKLSTAFLNVRPVIYKDTISYKGRLLKKNQAEKYLEQKFIYS